MRTGRRRWSGTAVAVVLVLTACTDDTGTPPPPVTGAPVTTSASPVPPLWRALPEAPIVGRIDAGAVWTGKEMVVWGGFSRTPDARPVGDGAAYDPAANSWRTIAPAPPGMAGSAKEGAVWTGDEAVFWASNVPDGPTGGAVYNPRTDTWRTLSAGPLGVRQGYASAWTGSEMVILGGAGGRGYSTPVAAAVDPRTGSWRTLAAFDDLFGLVVGGAVWDGHEVLAMGTLSLCPELGSGCNRTRLAFTGYDPKTDVRREIDLTDSPLEVANVPDPIGWTGTEVVFATFDEPSAGLVRYNPGTGKWRTGADAPCRVEFSGYVQRAWLDGRWVVPCNDDLLQIHDLDTDAWTQVDSGPSPMHSRSGSAIVWTGTDLIAWSGTVGVEGNPTPNDGAAITLSR